MVVNIAWDVLLVLLMLGSLVAIFTGAGLLIKPEKLEKVFAKAAQDSGKRKAGARHAGQFEKLFYRHHRYSGAAIFCSALIILYVFLLTDTKQQIALALPDDAVILLDAGVAFFVIAAVFAAQVGAAVFIRPSMLREVERVANRLVSLGMVSRLQKKIHCVFASFALRYKKALALFFIASGFYICTVAGLVLYRQQLIFWMM